jgi:hypothetical protein
MAPVAFAAVTTLLAALAVAAALGVVGGALGVLRGQPALARVTLPVGVLVAFAIGVADDWSTPAALLPLSLGAAALVLAYRIPKPTGWNVLCVFVAGGVICGYGLLARLLCEDTSVPCSGIGVARGATVIGAIIAAIAFTWLYLRAVDRA